MVEALWQVELRGFEPLTPCMPCSFGLLLRPRSEADAEPDGPLQVTVSVRYIPLVTAAYGTWVARPAGTNASPACRLGLPRFLGGSVIWRRQVKPGRQRPCWCSTPPRTRRGSASQAHAGCGGGYTSRR